MNQLPVPPSPVTYKNDDLVYVDPETRTVVGIVEWGKNGRPLSKLIPPAPPSADVKGKKRSFQRKYYPWGTYRSMRKIYKLEGKMKEPEPNRTLEEILPKALNEAFWKNENPVHSQARSAE